MSNKNEAVKNETAKKVTEINLKNISEKLSKVSENLKEKGGRKDSLYNYTEEEVLKIKQNGDNGKNIRNSIRRSFDNLTFNVAISAKKGDAEKVKENLKKFVTYYKMRCKVNDFSVSSVTNKKNEGKNEIFFVNLEITLQLCKENAELFI